MTYCIINCTVQNENDAQLIAKHLINKQLIACCNIIPAILSIYKWDGHICEDSEVLMIMKTKSVLYKQVEQEIKNIHKYDVPEIISVPIIDGNKAYLDWLDKETL
ncbi:MAG: divalent-cation tolerance protein CutA [Candidatus Gastranaerophilales bacterium]|nr:divalent-cation tolerance protein CutA [Candidatus Gastranaerophilales bacterium]